LGYKGEFIARRRAFHNDKRRNTRRQQKKKIFLNFTEYFGELISLKSTLFSK